MKKKLIKIKLLSTLLLTMEINNININILILLNFLQIEKECLLLLEMKMVKF